jgi:polyisoprenoid-binding protein YceI
MLTWISTTGNVVLSKCDLKFEVINAGFTVEGSLKATVVAGNFHPEKLDDSQVIIVASPATINTGIPIRDKHLQRTDYFNTNAFPDIKLVSQSFEKKSGNKFLGKFKLSIKGITKDCEVSFAIKSYGDQKKYEGVFVINRIDFDIGKSSLTIADEVLVKFSIS